MHRKLYYSGLSPYARNIRIILSELALEFESDRFDKMRPVDEISLINPNLTIPVLEDKKITLFDSRVIIEYLFETYGQENKNDKNEIPFFPHLHRSDNKWEDLKVLASLESMTESMVSIFLHKGSMERAGLDSAKVDYVDRQRIRVDGILDWLDSLVTKDGFYPGYLTLVDIQLISALGMCDAVNLLDWSGRSSIEGLVANFQSRNSVIDTAP